MGPGLFHGESLAGYLICRVPSRNPGTSETQDQGSMLGTHHIFNPGFMGWGKDTKKLGGPLTLCKTRRTYVGTGEVGACWAVGKSGRC